MKIQSIFAPGFAALALMVGVSSQAQYTVDATGMPILNSNPNAIGVAYIDFNGGSWQGVTRGAYSTDTDPTTFNTSEQNDIYKAWLDVSTHFAMFDINVTTVAPNKNTTPTAHVLVTPDMSNAAANVNFFGDKSTSARGAAQSSYARTRSTAITHELGHIMGLLHQSAYDVNGTMTTAYRGADSWNIAPIMGVDYAGKFSSWQSGYTGTNRTPQDDIAFMTSKISAVYNTFTGGSYSGDGFRADEHGNTFSTATLIGSGGGGGDTGGGKGNGKGGGTGGGGGKGGKGKTTTSNVIAEANFVVSGIIERYTDVDMFSLNWLGGDMFVAVEALKNVAASPIYASSLGMDLFVYNSLGQLLSQDLSANPADVDASLSLTALAAGSYYIGIESAGGYDDLGAYSLSISSISAALAFEAITAVPEPTSLAILLVGGLLVVRRRRG